MNLEQYFSVPANRERVLSIVSRVLLALEPSGAELELGYLKCLIDLAVKAEVIVADRWDVAGRFCPSHDLALDPSTPAVTTTCGLGPIGQFNLQLRHAVPRDAERHGDQRPAEGRSAASACWAAFSDRR